MPTYLCEVEVSGTQRIVMRVEANSEDEAAAIAEKNPAICDWRWETYDEKCIAAVLATEASDQISIDS